MRDDTACPSCQGRRLLLREVLTNPAYHAACCRDCGMAFMHPYPPDDFLEAHYAARDLYNLHDDTDAYGRAVADRAALIAGLLQREPRLPSGGKSVDFGAGVGIAVAAQASLGFQAMGVEANPEAQRAGRDLFGVDIRNLRLDDLPDDLSLFTLFEVLEHIKYPGDFLSAVHGHMVENGALAGSVPNYQGLARYLKGKHSIALAWPEHVNYFTRDSLRRTLTQAGFEVVYIGFPPPYGVVVATGLRSWLRKTLPKGLHGPLVNGVTWLKKHLVYPLPNRIAEKTGWLGHGLVFVARRV